MALSRIFYPALAGVVACGLAGGVAVVLAQGSTTPVVPRPKTPTATAKPPPAAQKPTQLAPQGASQAAPAGADKQGAPGPSPFDENINRSGVKTCAKGYVGLGQGLLPLQSEFATLFQWNKENADAHSVQSLVGIRASDQNVAGVIFAVPVGGVCEGQFVRVTPVATSCSAFAREMNPKSTVQANLGQIPVIATAEGLHVLLVPAGETACTVVLVGRVTL
ncbi:hypothetical protein [Bradyrhizobium brasilense]|uniref:hypothetical protein n=1 Tax=Bradyrhizobium brasilense TaxID=1419277 RepID=UPI0011788882|nr:hypothetical protein [Bradyrhizobium brasilense]